MSETETARQMEREAVRRRMAIQQGVEGFTNEIVRRMRDLVDSTDVVSSRMEKHQIGNVLAVALETPSVELVKKLGLSSAASLVNAVLRRVADRKPDAHVPSIIENPVLHIALSESYPQWLVRRWVAQLGSIEALRYAKGLNAPRRQALRVNRLRADLAQAAARLEGEGLKVAPCRFAPAALRIESLAPAAGNLESLPSFSEDL